MERRIILTEDGSHSLYVEGMDEPYHSVHGAIQESRHVFIESGLNFLECRDLRILELGFGTGLNALLTLIEAEKRKCNIHFHSVEKYPLTEKEYGQLNFEKELPDCPEGSLNKMHSLPWNQKLELSPRFSLYKEHADFREMEAKGPFDLVYYDAFAPQKQAHLWSQEQFEIIARLMRPGGVLVSYTAMGSVRRAMKACGFLTEKIPGPPGKREMVRARFQ